MRKVSLLVAVTLLTLTGAARAQDEAPAAPAGDSAAAAPTAAPETVAAPAAAPAAADSKMQLGLNLLPMALGKVSSTDPLNGGSTSADLAFAYGVGLSFGYAVIPGLTIGVAPQALFNVKGKDASGTASKEYDLMARVAYAYTVAPKFAIYAEVLPGYSIISNPSPADAGKGLVLAGGVGATMDVTDQVFLNLGVGYQMGFQKISQSGMNIDEKAKFLRIALGAGVKL
jgi:opacity protein-like surface antigen